jgi:hypothetical protein
MPVARGATASLVCGMLAYTPAWILAGIPAIVLGHRARKAIRARPDSFRGSDRSLLGLILGYSSIAATPVIAVALGLMAGAVPAIKVAAKKTEATQMSFALVVALGAYVTEYQRLPSAPTGNPTQDGELDNHAVLDVLRSLNSERNPRKVVFFEARAQAFSNGVLTDPWGRPYHIAVDMDGDGKIVVGGMSVNKPIAVWSDGPNGIDERGGGDDAKNW